MISSSFVLVHWRLSWSHSQFETFFVNRFFCSLFEKKHRLINDRNHLKPYMCVVFVSFWKIFLFLVFFSNWVKTSYYENLMVIKLNWTLFTTSLTTRIYLLTFNRFASPCRISLKSCSFTTWTYKKQFLLHLNISSFMQYKLFNNSMKFPIFIWCWCIFIN